MRARLPAAALIGASLLLAACTGAEGETDGEVPPLGGEDGQSTDSGPADDPGNEEPYAVPDEIDEAYAEEVINALLEIDTEALIIALEQEPGEPLGIEAVDRIHAISVGERRATAMEDFQSYVDHPERKDAFLPPDEIAPSRIDLDSIYHYEPDRCLLVVGWWDRTTLAIETSSPDNLSMFSLSRIDRDVTTLERNPTPWAIRHISPMESDGEQIPRERWGDINFGDALDRSCKEL